MNGFDLVPLVSVIREHRAFLRAIENLLFEEAGGVSPIPRDGQGYRQN